MRKTEAKLSGTGNIVKLFTAGPADLATVKTALDTSHLVTPGMGLTALPPASPDLTGKRKVLLVCGAGRTGKTTFLRWAIEQAETPVALATLDPVNRALKYYFEDCMSPTGAATSGYLQFLLSTMIKQEVSGAIDFGGGDTSLLGFVQEMPGVGAEMSRAGLATVLVMLLSPRIEDLTLLAALREVGFTPSSTLLVCNLGLDVPAWAFDEVRGHPVYQGAITAGAAEAWMPKNFAAEVIEHQRISFTEAAHGTGLMLFDRIRADRWLSEMTGAFAHVRSWLP